VNEDFKDFLACLLRTQARFLVVGAHALAVQGVPRATGDLDIWIDASAENADMMTAITGVEFEDAWQRKEIHRIDEAEIPFIGRRDFITNTRATGRLRDLADIEALGETP